MEFYATCARGFEPYVAGELRSFGAQQVRPLRGGVSFAGELKDAYTACMWSRLASRILLVLGRFDASDADALYAGCSKVPWEEHLAPTGTLAVDARGTNDALRNTQFTAVLVKDAVVDRLRSLAGERPSVNVDEPDVRINVVVHGTKATVSIDLSGEPLHRRGYRVDRRQTEAPLKENLAACVLAAAAWYRHCRHEAPALLDPMCGSGTLAIEAALQALDRAPGLMRDRWGFTNWLGHDEDAFHEVLDDADERADRGSEKNVSIVASDMDPVALELAQANAKRAGVAKHINFICADVAYLVVPSALGESGLVVTNPPYAERMGSLSQLPALYAALSSLWHQDALRGWDLAVITPDASIDAALGAKPAQTVEVMNGPIESTIRVYAPLADTQGAGEPDDRPTVTVGDNIVVPVLVEASDQFAARFAKVAKQRAKWARKNGISAYRIYDADLPDYAVAIDLYEGAGKDLGKRLVQVAEYQAPKSVDPDLATRRLYDVLAIVPKVLGIESDQVICKVRKRTKGGSQYGKESERAIEMLTEEGGLVFKVNLTQYLDTGLFLDHRITRDLVRTLANDKRFLNLFAYTGSATCYAADGGAFETTTVDLSKTYLDWARENMRNNGFAPGRHIYVEADCLRWIAEQRRTKNRWDLIFCDPPTFSNSKQMGRRDFDVQRDHVELLIGISRLLTRGGQAIFSCNLRNFTPDLEALAKAGVTLEDITAQTIPEDFARNPKIHKCYRVTRS